MAIDLLDLATAVDPHALTADLRAEAPVLRLPSGFIAVTGHAAAIEALRSTRFGSSAIGALYRDRLPEGAARDEMSNRINFLDPPDHPRVRRLVAKAFTPRRVATLTPWIDRAARDHAATVDHTAAFDLLADVAHLLPAHVISELLGVPVDDRHELARLAAAVVPLLSPTPSPEEVAAAVNAAEVMHARLEALVSQRRVSPSDDLLGALVEVEDAGERLEHAELMSLVATMYSAGHRTTRDAFVNGMARLLSDDAALWARVVAAEWDLDAVAWEMLRLDTPTHYVARVVRHESATGEVDEFGAVETVELAGVEIAPGEVLLVMLAAANRDPSVFSNPDDFNPQRPPAPNLAFAYGPHYCLGASLAIAEIRAMLAAAIDRWPSLRLAPGAAPAWHQRGPFRSLDRLDVTTD